MTSNKKQMHHLWTRLRPLKPWYFFALAAVFGVIGAFALRDNNLRMAELRDAVYAADKSGHGVEESLQELRSYVGSHMNTSLSSGSDSVYPPIQLKYTYQRLVEKAGSTTSEENATLYSSAQKYCEKKIPTGFSGRYRLNCIQQYISQHGSAATNIPDSLYKFDFASPRWSPDLAGWTMVLAILSLAVGISLVAVRRFVHQRAK
ncbi:hypothetical protein KDA23_03990 [Candidatus Saccharibacteria bacterium]|nr:hypothetical protein [Candidatus Saccharibacteria bacterium]